MHRRIIIAGNRDFNNRIVFDSAIIQFVIEYEPDIEIISGHCVGADSMGEWYAKKWGIPLKIFPADWDKYGKSAGAIRNKQMAEYASNCNGMLVAFWDGKSSGTKNMIHEAEKYGIEIHIINWKRQNE